MYPSNSHPSYGTFVETFYNELARNCKKIRLVKITKSKKKIFHLYKYIFYCFEVFSLRNVMSGNTVVAQYGLHTLIPLLIIQKKFKLIINFHGGDINQVDFLSRFMRRLLVPVWKSADGFIFPSHEFMTMALEKYPVLKGTPTCINYSLAYDPCLLEIPLIDYSEEFDFGFVSRIDAGKGWLTFLEAAQLLLLDNPSATFCIWGTGNDTKKLQEELIKRDLSKNVFYRGGFSTSDTLAVYRSFRTMVFASELPESLGLVGLEAMAAGRHIVASDHSSIREYLGEFSKYCFQPGSRHQLLCQLRAALDIKTVDLRVLSQRSRNRALVYSRDACTKYTASFIEEIDIKCSF